MSSVTLLEPARIERLTLDTVHNHTLSSPAVPSVLFDDSNWQPIFVLTAEASSGPVPEHAIGSIRRGLSNSTYWIMQEAGGQTWRTLTAAVVNPPLQDGKYYALLNEVGGPENFIVRYNDDDHRGDRHRAHLPFSIITAKGGAAWIHTADALAETSIDDTIYVEVQPPVTAGEPAVSEGEDEPVPEPAEEPLVEHVDGSPEGPTMGLAEVNGDGHVVVSPTPVEGRFYIHWNSERRHTNILAQYKGGEWKSMGYYQRLASGGTPTGELQYIQSAGMQVREETRWALARLETPAVPELQDLAERRANLQRQLNEQTTKWSRLDEALLDLARDKDWCSEFESFAVPLGFSPRETKGDWDVMVDVTFTASIDSPDSSVDSKLEDYYDLPGLSMTSMTISGTMRVCVSVGDETEDGARNYIDTSVIYEAIDSSADITIDDWSIDSVNAA